jgi:hypothetical protein
MRFGIHSSSRAFVLVVALASSALHAHADYSSEVLADAPVAYWKLDDASQPASDATGNDHGAGTAMPTVEFSQDPLHLNALAGGHAADFSGNGQLLSAPFEKMDGGGFSVEFWIKFNSAPLGFTNLVGDGEAGGDFMLMVYAGGNGFVRAHTQTTAGVVAIDSAERIAFGGTHHVVSTWDSTSGELILYLDGVQVGSGSNLGAPINSDNPIYIGQDGREASAPDAVMDEVAIYNFPLSPARVAAHFDEAEIPDPPDPPDPPDASGVRVGNSTLIGELDYSDSFTIGATAPSIDRQNYAAQGFPLPGGVEVVEDVRGNAAANWPSDAWSIATDLAINPGATGYPGTSKAGSDTGITQRGGGGDWSIPYGLRDVFIVQSDFVQLDDRVDFIIGATPGNIFGAGNISIFFRRTAHPSFPEIGIFNGALESNTGLTSGIGATVQWFNYALLVDVPKDTIEVFVNEVSRGVIDLATVGAGAYAGILSNAFVGIGGAGNDRLWSDNFQIGSPGAAAQLAITAFSYDTGTSDLSLTWNSKPDTGYILQVSFDLTRWIEINDGIDSQGQMTSYLENFSGKIPPGKDRLFFRVVEF